MQVVCSLIEHTKFPTYISPIPFYTWAEGDTVQIRTFKCRNTSQW